MIEFQLTANGVLPASPSVYLETVKPAWEQIQTGSVSGS